MVLDESGDTEEGPGEGIGGWTGKGAQRDDAESTREAAGAGAKGDAGGGSGSGAFVLSNPERKVDVYGIFYHMINNH